MTPDEAKSQAQKALGGRLKAWGVDQSLTRSDDFINALMAQGWKYAPGVGYRPPKAEDACRTHPGEWAGQCRACASDRLAGTPTPRRQTRTEKYATRADELRALKAAATADLCRHGAKACKECETTETAASAANDERNSA